MQQEQTEIKGAALKAITNVLGYKQSELAELMGVAPSNVSRVFTGETPPSQEFIEKFINATGMPIRFIENFDLSDLYKIGSQYNFNDNANFGANFGEINTLNLTKNDIKEFHDLSRENQILLIKQNITELKRSLKYAKASKSPKEELEEIQESINEKYKEIANIEAQLNK